MFFVSICCRSIPKVPNATILCRALTAVGRQWACTSIPTSATCTLSAPARAGWDEHIDESSESSNTQQYINLSISNIYLLIPFQAFRHTCAEGTLFSVATGECMFEVQQYFFILCILLIIGGGGLQGAKREACRVKRKQRWNKNLIVPPLFTIG